MSDEPAKRIGALETELATIRARLKAAIGQRDEALNSAIVSKAAAELQIEQLRGQLQQFAGALQKAETELKVFREKEAKAAEDAKAAADVALPQEKPALAPPANGNGHAAEACPQA